MHPFIYKYTQSSPMVQSSKLDYYTKKNKKNNNNSNNIAFIKLLSDAKDTDRKF